MAVRPRPASGTVVDILSEAASAIEEMAVLPKDFISVVAAEDKTLARITIFRQDEALASIDFDADQLDILMLRIASVRDAINGHER